MGKYSMPSELHITSMNICQGHTCMYKNVCIIVYNVNYWTSFYLFKCIHVFQHQRHLKKQARREQVASHAAQHNTDVALICQVLELQSLMDDLSEDVRTDFLNGTNGAVVSSMSLCHLSCYFLNSHRRQMKIS